jgi:cytoskeletal protein RodZ
MMPSFGENLRRERELRGIALREIADSTKISIRFLQALEQDRFDILPGGIFQRAFVRQYARHVGLDAERLVAEFVYARGEESAPAPSAPVRPATPPRGTLMIAIGIAGLGLLALLRSAPSRAAREAPAPAPPVPASILTDRVYPPPSTQKEQDATAAGGLVLTMNARERCWVGARVDGQTVLDRVLLEGETQTIEATGEIVLSVGNAGGLAFRLNDRQGVPLGQRGEVRRNIVITRESLKALVEGTDPVRTSHSS